MDWDGTAEEGEIESERSTASLTEIESQSKETRERKTVLTVDGFEVIYNAFYLLQDIAKGVSPFDSDTRAEGKLGLFFFDVPLKATVSCQVYVNIYKQTIVRQDCYPEDGTNEQPGVIPRALEGLFRQVSMDNSSVETATLETRVKVSNPEDPEPSLNLYVENQADPAMRLVFEMMVLCGEAIATFGSRNNIPLPYRGQPQSDINLSVFSYLPEGPVRSFALVKVMRAAEIDFRKPARRGVFGIPSYVQFTSPIRRYLDLLAHYQKHYLGLFRRCTPRLLS